MAITPFSAVPSRATGQDTFSADVETFWGQLPTFVNEVNAFGVGLSSQITTSSTTSLLVGTGSKTLTVGTGLGFQVGMPIRLAFSDTVYMTGDVTSYNSVTGELICNITSSTGSGTYTVWAVYPIPTSITNVPDGDKGDITVSGAGATWTIDNNVITGAKLSTTVLNDFSTSTPALGDFIPFADIANSNSNAKATVENVVKAATNASGAAPIFSCRAWVNFNGTGTVAISGSGNVSSITDNGTGDYTVNFTTGMPDSNYCLSGSVQVGSGTTPNSISGGTNFSKTISSVRFQTFQVGGGGVDPVNVNVAIFR